MVFSERVAKPWIIFMARKGQGVATQLLFVFNVHSIMYQSYSLEVG